MMAERQIEAFVETDPTVTGARWEQWVKRFENRLNLKKVKETDKLCWLIDAMSEYVFAIYESLPDTGHTYQQALSALNHYFSPKKNAVFNRYNFRQTKQMPDETFAQFYLRLRTMSMNCDFANSEIISWINLFLAALIKYWCRKL